VIKPEVIGPVQTMIASTMKSLIIRPLFIWTFVRIHDQPEITERNLKLKGVAAPKKESETANMTRNPSA
jgi:hypothetical protein